MQEVKPRKQDLHQPKVHLPSESILSAEQSTNENGTVNTSASVQEAPKIKFFRRYIDGMAGRR